MSERTPLIAGNWKMFGRLASLSEIDALAAPVERARRLDVVVCPPALYLQEAALRAHGTRLRIGAQDCSAASDDGARTGDVSAAMLKDVGVRYVIVGHSERRSGHGESDAVVRAKAQAALASGVIPIICVGESSDERAAGRAALVVAEQVKGSTPVGMGELVIAYEPVWAIGAAVTPTISEISDIHVTIRQSFDQIGGLSTQLRILYGGSVAPANAAAIFSADGVDGALVGRASQKAADFAAIILSHPAVA